MDARARAAERALCVGIGGGGDVVGALAAARGLESMGAEGTVLGGLTWERRPIDPLPGPRTLDEVQGADPLPGSSVAALAGPQARGPGGFRFAEGRLAEALGEPTLLVDPNPGPAAVGAALAEAARALGCGLVALVDVGGDVLGHGHEAGLASPLADAVLLAAAPHVTAAGIDVVAAVFGAGCDGELTPDEVLDRIAEVAAAGGLLGAWAPTPVQVAELEAAVAAVPTEASAMAVRCARGATGEAEIRGGRRTVRLTPAGGLCFFLDAETALRSAARCAALVRSAGDLREANDRLHAAGIRTELDYEEKLAPRMPAER